VSTRVADALQAVLPTEEETLFLRTCLCDDESGREAWTRLRAPLSDPLDVLRGPRAHLRGLGPLLYEALRRDETGPEDRTLLSVLRAASVREEARERTLRAVVAQALRETDAPVVLKGAALADLAYPRVFERHTHDLDLWGARDEARPHPSGTAIVVHRHLFRLPWYREAQDAMRSRVVGAEVAGVPARVLAPADMLAHVCVHAFSLGGRNVAHWVPDAWFALRRVPDAGWEELAVTAEHGRLALPLACTLGWLSDALGAPVPPSVLAALRERAGRAGPVDRDTALACAWAGRSRLDLRTRAGRRRAGMLGRWALLPAPGYLRASRGANTRGRLAVAYLARPWRYASGRLTAARGRATGAKVPPC
jgi:hypothetical protein